MNADVEALNIRDIGPGLKDLAKAIREAPPSIAHETQAARQAFDLGLTLGLLCGAVIGLVAGLFLVRRAP